jgi:hypothetical protein
MHCQSRRLLAMTVKAGVDMPAAPPQGKLTKIAGTIAGVFLWAARVPCFTPM